MLDSLKPCRSRTQETVTCTPLRSIRIGRICPPASATAFSTASRDPRNLLQVCLDLPFSVNVRLENFPVVDPRLPRLSRVTQHKPLLELAYVKPQLHSALSARRQFNRRRTAECRWIMILRTSGNANHDSFRIAADMNPVHFALPCRGESVQCRADSHCHRAGPPDARTRRSF